MYQPGDIVLIVKTMHRDLLGKLGEVEHVFESGNMQVSVGSEYVVLGPEQVRKSASTVDTYMY